MIWRGGTGKHFRNSKLGNWGHPAFPLHIFQRLCHTIRSFTRFERALYAEKEKISGFKALTWKRRKLLSRPLSVTSGAVHTLERGCQDSVVKSELCLLEAGDQSRCWATGLTQSEDPWLQRWWGLTQTMKQKQMGNSGSWEVLGSRWWRSPGERRRAA